MDSLYNVLIVDDDNLVCKALEIILKTSGKVNVMGIGNSGNDAISLFDTYNPDILLMDIRMEGLTGLDAGEQIIEAHKDAKILFLTTFADEEYIVKALKLGAKGYILKQNFDCIVPSIDAVMNGQRVFGDEIISKIPSIYSPNSESNNKINELSKFDLSEREIQVITKIAEGLSNKEISEILFLSEGTVRNYISIILEKLSLRDRTQIAIFYYKHQ